VRTFFDDHRIVRATLLRALAGHVVSITLELLKSLVSKGFCVRVAKLSFTLRGPLERTVASELQQFRRSLL